MDFFKRYSSNTYAGSGNQLYFNMHDDEIKTGRIIYKISVGGEYDYSILFSNIMDSTYSDGSVSHKNLILDSWKIHNAKIGRCRITATDKNVEEMTFAGMIGCDRHVKGKIAYLGDSITQGIGTERNSYLHWNAILSEKLGADYAFWNLGIGYGRANDAASDGAWLYKAKQADVVFVCYGVNDILQEFSEEQIKKDLETIVDSLKKSGKKVILQTVPPFEFQEKDIEKWQRINVYIKSVLKDKGDMIFDNNPYLCTDSFYPKYGGHPNAEGCAVWADALYEATKPFIESVL